MTWNPIDFKDLPDETTPIDSNNLNYLQQGIIAAIDQSSDVFEAWQSGSLKGEKGDRGAQGVQGIQGIQGVQGQRGEKGDTGATGLTGATGSTGAQGERGLKGDKGDTGAQGIQGAKGNDGTSFHIDGTVALLADLPPPDTVPDQWWVSYEFGHLHHSDGVEWHDVAQFVGIKGDTGEQGIQGIQGVKGDKGDTGERGLQGLQGAKGDTGATGAKGDRGERGEQGIQGVQGERGIDGVFDIDQITDEQLSELHTKLTALNDKQFWSYQSHIASGQTVRFKVADLNLDLLITRTSATIAYKFVPNNTAEPAIYYVNRLSNYDLVAWESSATLNYQAQAIAASGFNLDASGYLAGREQTLIQVIDPSTNIWYSIYFIGLGEGTMFIDVTKRVNKNREIVPAT